MPSPTSQITERLGWDGAVSIEAAAAIFVALAIVTGWSLWRERYAVGPAWAGAFFCCRLAAFACALWMLAGPTRLRIERQSTAQSIAVFADGSQSMDVVDPPDALATARWTLAGSGSSEKTAAELCDRLEMALAATLSQCARLSQLVDEHRDVRSLETVLAAARRTIDRAANHGEAMMALIDDEDLVERALRVDSLLQGVIRESCGRLEDALQASADGALGEAFAAELELLADGLSSARQRAAVLGEDLALRHAESSPQRIGETQLQTRREKAGRALDAFEAGFDQQVREQVDLRRFQFDGTPTPIDAGGSWAAALGGETSPTGDSNDSAAVDARSSTNLSAVLRQVAAIGASESVRLAIILSDGRHNEAGGPAPQDVAAELGDVPLYVVPIGNSVEVRDLALHRVEAPAAVTEGDVAVVETIVTASACDGEASTLVLRRDGVEIDRKPLRFEGARSDYRVRFDVPAAELGWQEYVVEVEPVADEANSANNFMPVSFEVVQDKIRVLLADGLGRWEYRYLNQLFRREPHVEFDELLFLPRVHGTGALAARPQLPRDLEGWARYDVVILGDVNSEQLPADGQASLDEYVRKRGGRLIVVAGRDAMPGSFKNQPLLELLPVERAAHLPVDKGFALELTDEGQIHSALMIADDAEQSREAWRETYRRFPVFSLSEYSRPKPTARTLIEAVSQAAGAVRGDREQTSVDHAFLSWHRVGAGRVAYLAAPETFRLRFRRGDRMHHRFWGQFLRWMTAADAGSGTELVRLQTDRTKYAENEAVEVTVWLKDSAGRPLANEKIEAEATTFDKVSSTTELQPDPEVAGRYFGTLEGLPAGAYQIGVRGPVIDTLMPPDSKAPPVRATITVSGSSNVEMLNTQCNRALLEQLAQITGGQVIPPTAIGEAIELASFTPQESERVERTPLWNRWRYLLVIASCLFTEWVVRKSKGLV